MIISAQILEFEVSIESYWGLKIIDMKYENKKTSNIYIPKGNTGFYMLASKSRPQYISIDTSNSNICTLVTIFTQNVYLCVFL